MDKPRPCGCKGCRTCLVCEQQYGIETKSFEIQTSTETYVYCPLCNCAWPGWDIDDWKQHPNHTGNLIEYPGVFIDSNFLGVDEEERLLKGIDHLPWDPSQSGRLKQNYGPKCNFKKRKLRLGDFCGFPKFSQFVQDKFKDVEILKGFQTIEQCSLEYDPERGASIDPHIDDCWVWGERIVTVNLLSDSVLTMTYNKKHSKYNLDCVGTYPAVLKKSGEFNTNGSCYNLHATEERSIVIRIPMPRRSLLVMYGAARYDWEHQVLREDIVERRICLAYREFTPTYLSGSNEGRIILDKALEFWDID